MLHFDAGCPSVCLSIFDLYVLFSLTDILKKQLMDSSQTWVIYESCRANEVNTFWGHEAKRQSSRGSLCMQL